MGFRTDLALERAGSAAQRQVEQQDGLRLSRQTEGHTHYVTVEAPQITGTVDGDSRLRALLTRELQALLPAGEILVAGLGNPAVTPDAVGPLCADRLLATRHVKGRVAQEVGLGNLRGVAVVKTGVLGSTGIETAEQLQAMVRQLRPAAVVAVDALAAGQLSRLGKTVQLCDGGISPGSGVGNDRPSLCEARVGAPVIGLGVPTVVDAATLCSGLGGSAQQAAARMMVTPRDVDTLVQRAAHVLALALNCALNPSIEAETYEQLVCG